VVRQEIIERIAGELVDSGGLDQPVDRALWTR
jgi:hypothetical protein